ncbi:MAG: cupin domain-containing protein [candidate division Zixibacteria bacterium]|nr:cupin domain-containing protein [candidate division Zixibacteria bacterium]
MKYTRLYSDADGKSHFEDVELEFHDVDFAPPAPPLDISTFGEVETCSLLKAAPGWKGDWHPAPFRQLHFYLSGEVEAQVSDGERRRIRAGEFALVEDTTGKGHRSHVVGDKPVTIVVVKLGQKQEINR